MEKIFEKYKIYANLILLTERNFEISRICQFQPAKQRRIFKLCKICNVFSKMEKNFEIMKNNQCCPAKQRRILKL